MPEALPIRDDMAPEELRRLARRESNGRVVARMLALEVGARERRQLNKNRAGLTPLALALSPGSRS